MRSAVLLLLLFFGLGRLAPAQQAPPLPPALAFDENFQDNSRSWFTGDDATWRVAVANGEYRLDNRLVGGHLTWRPLPINSDQDFALEVELLGTAGGFVWGGSGADNINFVGVMPGQRLAVARWRGGQWQWVSPPTGASAPTLHDNTWNTVRIARQGATVRYYANGHS